MKKPGQPNSEDGKKSQSWPDKISYEEALSKINEIVSLEPKIPAALFLNSQALWKGFKDRGGAKACLLRVMQIEPHTCTKPGVT